MIVALLVLVVLILLFGAGVVKGWLSNIVGFGCGGFLILVALLWLGSFFGDNGVTYIMYAVGAFLLALVVVGLIVQSDSPTASSGQAPRNTSPLSSNPRDKIWQRWSADIAFNFSPEARATAQRLYDDNQATALDQFCREEMKRRRGE